MRTIIVIALLAILTFTLAADFRLKPLAETESDLSLAKTFEKELKAYAIKRGIPLADSESDIKFGKALKKVGKVALEVGKAYGRSKGLPLADAESDIKFKKILGKVGKAALEVGKAYGRSKGLPLADAESDLNFDEVLDIVKKAKQIHDIIKGEEEVESDKINWSKVGDVIKKANAIRGIIQGEEVESEIYDWSKYGQPSCFCVRAPCNCGPIRREPAVEEESEKFNWDKVGNIIKKADAIRGILQGEDIEEESDSMGSQSGGASYYSDYFNGRTTANGEKFSNSASTCAHKTLPFGTWVTVRNTANGKTARCRVNDRGPYVSGRIIDLSKAVFGQLAPISQGVMNVQISY